MISLLTFSEIVSLLKTYEDVILETRRVDEKDRMDSLTEPRWSEDPEMREKQKKFLATAYRSWGQELPGWLEGY